MTSHKMLHWSLFARSSAFSLAAVAVHRSACMFRHCSKLEEAEEVDLKIARLQASSAPATDPDLAVLCSWQQHILFAIWYSKGCRVHCIPCVQPLAAGSSVFHVINHPVCICLQCLAMMYRHSSAASVLAPSRPQACWFTCQQTCCDVQQKLPEPISSTATRNASQ